MKPRSLFLCLVALPLILLASVLSVRALKHANLNKCDTEYQTCHYNAAGDPDIEAGCVAELTACYAACSESGCSNNPPIANNDAVSIKQNKKALISPLSNDSDPDGDALQIVAVSAPGHGVATVTAGSAIAYDPKNGFKGVDAFTYTISDGNGGVATATVTVEVGAKKNP